MEKILTLKWVLKDEFIMENTDMGYVAVVTTAWRYICLNGCI